MKRFKKKHIVAFPMVACMLLVTDPFIETQLTHLSTSNTVSHVSDLGDKDLEYVVEIMNTAQGLMHPVFMNRVEEEIKAAIGVTVEPGETTDTTVEETVNDGQTEENESPAEEPKEEPAEEAPVDPEAEAQAKLEEKVQDIYDMLSECGEITFYWKDTRIHLTSDEFDYLCRLVYREAQGEDVKGKLLVANVVFNRVAHPYYPDNVVDVINQSGQFAPVRSGSIKTAVPDQGTILGVMYAIAGVDESQGAMYFKQRGHYANWDTMTHLFYYGCHDFYK